MKEEQHAPGTGQPVGLPESVRLSLNVALSLTKKYLDMVGVQEIGNLQIAELREVHYQVRNAITDLERASKRETGNWQEPFDAADNKRLLKWAYEMIGNSCPHVLTETAEGRFFEKRVTEIEGDQP